MFMKWLKLLSDYFYLTLEIALMLIWSLFEFICISSCDWFTLYLFDRSKLELRFSIFGAGCPLNFKILLDWCLIYFSLLIVACWSISRSDLVKVSSYSSTKLSLIVYSSGSIMTSLALGYTDSRYFVWYKSSGLLDCMPRMVSRSSYCDAIDVTLKLVLSGTSNFF